MFVGEIDPESGRLLSRLELPDTSFPAPAQLGAVGSGFAMASWGGDFYVFMGDGIEAVVSRFRISDGSYERIAALPNASIVGAGRMPCAER